MSTIQIKAVVVTCSNLKGETLLERAVRKDKRELATAIIKYGKAQAILTCHGRNDATVAAIKEAESKHVPEEAEKTHDKAISCGDKFWMGYLISQALANHGGYFPWAHTISG